MKKLLIMMLGLAMLFMVGCSSNDTTDQGNTIPEELKFDYSSKLDKNGFFKKVDALDYVVLPDYKNITIPKVIHTVGEEELQANIDAILAKHATTAEVTDRAVELTDTVNIDFVGTIDGEEFEGGNTNGKGVDAVIAETNFIDDFLEQLVGHTPGESFDVEVTFPENYGIESLNGKDAVFAVTINHIKEQVMPELSDAFVSEKLSEEYKVATVEALQEKIANDLQSANVLGYIQENMMVKSEIKEVPDRVMDFQSEMMKNYYMLTAYTYGMDLNTFISAYGGYESFDELAEESKQQLRSKAEYALIVQAIAEDLEMTVTEEDLAAYFKEYAGSEDYSMFEENYGLPYVKNLVMQELVHKYLIDNSELASE